MVYKAIDVAKYVLNYYSLCYNKCDFCQSISNLKLQKVLYFLQANHLCVLGKKLFSDEIKAVPFGVLVQEVYDKYKFYGGGSIFTPKNKIKECEYNIFNKDKQIINGMLDILNPHSDHYLLEIITRQTPWKNAYYQYPDKVIRDKDLIDFFSED